METKTKTKTDEAPREHKKPWQETFNETGDRYLFHTEAEKELHRHLQEMGGEGGEVE